MHRYTGAWDKQFDTTSSLVLMGARPYDPNLGRFLAVDPIDGGSLNNYDYAGQDAINWYDLDGSRASDCGGDPQCQLGSGGLSESQSEAQAKKDAGNRRTSGETEYTKLGRDMHVGLEAVLGPGWEYNVWLGPDYGYADAVNYETHEIVELKPNNPQARAQGMSRTGFDGDRVWWFTPLLLRA